MGEDCLGLSSTTQTAQPQRVKMGGGGLEACLGVFMCACVWVCNFKDLLPIFHHLHLHPVNIGQSGWMINLFCLQRASTASTIGSIA